MADTNQSVRRRPAFPENAGFGCVDCGSVNHTTGDLGWCQVAQAHDAALVAAARLTALVRSKIPSFPEFYAREGAVTSGRFYIDLVPMRSDEVDALCDTVQW
jgi:hypothetical protein